MVYVPGSWSAVVPECGHVVSSVTAVTNILTMDSDVLFIVTQIFISLSIVAGMVTKSSLSATIFMIVSKAST